VAPGSLPPYDGSVEKLAMMVAATPCGSLPP
jgi:hypothetical protein